MKKPEFFIAGAPKCGTSSLFNYLGQHPDVYMPDTKMKEPNFFSTDLTGPKYFKTKNDYQSLFKEAGNRIAGDASAFYLYSLDAPKNIFEYNPESKIIFMFRNPVDMLYSLHGQYLIDGNTETIENFIEALEAEEDRKKGKRIPRHCNRPEGLIYSEHAKYTQYLKNYFAVFPENQIKIILFDDFIKKSSEIYNEVLQFLELNAFSPEFKRMNQHEEPRFKKLHQIDLYLKHAPVIGNIRKNFTLKTGFFKKLESMNRVETERKKLPAETYNKLLERFKPDIIEFQEYIKKDLSTWLIKKS